jgi:hypothetical protein
VALFRPAGPEANLGSLGIAPITVARQILGRIDRERLAARFIRPFRVRGEQSQCALYVRQDLKKQKLHGMDLSWSELTGLLEQYRRDSYCPVSVVAYEDQGERRFAATFIEDPTRAAWHVDLDLTAADLAAKAAKLAAKGLTPASITACPWNGAVRYAVVWVTKEGK